MNTNPTFSPSKTKFSTKHPKISIANASPVFANSYPHTNHYRIELSNVFRANLTKRPHLKRGTEQTHTRNGHVIKASPVAI